GKPVIWANYFRVLISDKLSLEYLVFLFPFFYAALPVSFFDTLVYHLGIPNLYIQQGGFCATPQFVYANTSIYYEIAMIPAVFMGKLVPNFFHLFVGVVLLFAALRFARDYININKSLLLIILIISLPVSGFLLTTVKNDLAGALFILAGIRLLLEERFTAAGVTWGFAVGIKYFNILPLVIFLVLFTIHRKKFPVKRYFYFSLTFLAALIPLFLKNILYTGNPIFPFLYHLFPHGYWDESRSLMMARDVGRVCRTWKDFLNLPYDLSFKELGSGGRVGVQFLVFLPFMILLRRRGAASRASAAPAPGSAGKMNLLIIFSLLTIFLGCGFTASIRFLYLPFLILCMFVVWVYEQRPQRLMKFFMFIILVLNSASSVSMLNLLYNPQALYTQNMNRDEYIASTFPAYAAFRFLERHTPRSSMILVVGETRNYYLERPYKVSSALDYSILKPFLEKADNLDEWLAELRADGIDYLLVNFPEFHRLNSQYDRLSTAMQQKALSFFNRMEPLFQAKGVFIYRIKR
ncbi:MAG: hypothetical protein L0Y73_08185, partial [Candidatus Aminicenantes bacterium]|nr:hypothetical protein [Candidatus Aminicenantes bacterium]